MENKVESKGENKENIGENRELTIIKMKANMFDLMGERDRIQSILNQKFVELQNLMSN